MFCITCTNKGVRCLVLNNFFYRHYRQCVDGRTKWRCTNKICAAFVVTNGSVNQILDHQNKHNHDDNSNRYVERHEVRGLCKRKAENQLSERPFKIIRLELNSIENSTLLHQDVSTIRRAIYRTKRKSLPPNPRSRVDAFSSITIYGDSCTYDKN